MDKKHIQAENNFPKKGKSSAKSAPNRGKTSASKKVASNNTKRRPAEMKKMTGKPSSSGKTSAKRNPSNNNNQSENKKKNHISQQEMQQQIKKNLEKNRVSPKHNSKPPQPALPQPTENESWRKPPSGTPEYPYYNENLRAAKPKKFPVLRRAISIFTTTLISLFLIFIITGTIVATAMTVYVMSFRDEVSNVTIEEMERRNNTYIYANDAEGNPTVCLYEVNNNTERIPVTIDQIPQHVRDAFVYAEDSKFYTHDGVDYKRTFYSFANMFMHIYDTKIGGSTITQQLVKNITGDDVQSPSRKIREIFRAMELEQRYSKDEILAYYLNYIGFGGATNGIQMASQKYFGKDVGELSIAEAASLAAIPKSPNTLNPFASYTDETTGEEINTGREENAKRQYYVLNQMYENGAITFDEYQQALNEKLVFTDSEEYKESHPEEEENQYLKAEVTSWIVDTAIYEFADYLENTYNLTLEEAIERINAGGYRIDVTVDLDMQSYVEEKYLDLNNFVSKEEVALYLDENGDEEYTTDEIMYPQSSFIAMDYEGRIKAIVGAVGEKTVPFCWNYATMEPRQPGSTIKPLTTYGYGLENDKIHWGSMYMDEPLKKIDDKDWPSNYSNTYSRNKVPVYDALARSLNTVPARICDQFTPQAIFDFAKNKMGLKLAETATDGKTDNDLSPLSVGALTYGISLKNLVNGYIPFGNGGTYYNAHIISRVMQGNETLIYEDDGSPRRVINDQTAYVMNKLLQNVVDNGTGSGAKLKNKTVCGKTGTTENWYDLTFVGMTEDFVSGVWIGYTERHSLPETLKAAEMWSKIIGEYADSIVSGKKYPTNDSVIENYVCKKSGKIAGPYCTKGELGYWKSTNAPTCNECTGYVYTRPPVQNTTPIYDDIDDNPSSDGDLSGGDSGQSSGGDSSGGNSGGDSGGSSSGDSGNGSSGGNSGGNSGGDSPAPES